MAERRRPRRLWAALAGWLAGLFRRPGARQDAAGDRGGPAGPAALSWAYSYDALGRLTAQQDGLGGVLTFTYDGAGQRADEARPIAADVAH